MLIVQSVQSTCQLTVRPHKMTWEGDDVASMTGQVLTWQVDHASG
jgi:hypothetical protein